MSQSEELASRVNSIIKDGKEEILPLEKLNNPPAYFTRKDLAIHWAVGAVIRCLVVLEPSWVCPKHHHAHLKLGKQHRSRIDCLAFDKCPTDDDFSLNVSFQVLPFKGGPRLLTASETLKGANAYELAVNTELDPTLLSELGLFSISSVSLAVYESRVFPSPTCGRR